MLKRPYNYLKTEFTIFKRTLKRLPVYYAIPAFIARAMKWFFYIFVAAGALFMLVNVILDYWEAIIGAVFIIGTVGYLIVSSDKYDRFERSVRRQTKNG